MRGFAPQAAHACEIRCFQPFVHGVDGIGGAHHADFDGIDGDVTGNRLQLRCDRLGALRPDAADLTRVLRHNRGDDTHAIAAARHDAFHISEDSRTAGRVGACDGEDPRLLVDMTMCEGGGLVRSVGGDAAGGE